MKSNQSFLVWFRKEKIYTGATESCEKKGVRADHKNKTKYDVER